MCDSQSIGSLCRSSMSHNFKLLSLHWKQCGVQMYDDPYPTRSNLHQKAHSDVAF
jgi:hypothetical protein